MADKEKELKIKFDSVTLEDNPEEYCKALYAEAKTYQEDKLSAINVENRMFFEGHDTELDARATDKNLIRSSLFINEGKPAIDTRTASVLTTVEASGTPIVVRPKNPDATDEEAEQAKWITLKLTQQLRDSGYLSEIFEEHITASEIYRSPSAVKVRWDKETIKMPTVITPTEEEILEGATLQQKVPVARVEYRDKEVGKPAVEWLAPDEFLYDPHSSSLERDCNYTIHAGYEFYHDLMAMAKENGWDIAKIKSLKDMLGSDEESQTSADSIKDDIRTERGSEPDRGFRDSKILVAEFNIKTYTDSGTRATRQIVFVADKVIVNDEIDVLKEIVHPYVIARSNPLPGTLENFSSIDLIKRLGRFVNEVYNSWVDATTYSMFTVMKIDSGAQFVGTPVMGPGKIWKISPDKDAIAPINPFQVKIPDLTSLITFIADRLRRLLNSPDLAEGFNATPNEKATSSKLRSAGAARRAVPVNRRYGEALIGVSWMFLKLNRQFADDAVNYVLDVTIDAPGLTNITDVDREKEEEMVLLAQMLQNPLYQNPTGMRKIGNQMRDLVRGIKQNHVNIDDYVPTKEEVDQQIGIDTAKQNNQVEMAAAMQGQQPPQGT